jgi:hypothetical protein
MHRMHACRFAGAAALACLLNSTDARAEAEPTRDASRGLSGFIEFDIDLWGPQIWFGASHPLHGPVRLGSDVWMGLDPTNQHALGQFDMGPQLRVADGVVSLGLRAGMGFDFSAGRLQYLDLPQLYVSVHTEMIEASAWNQLYLYDLLDSKRATPDRPPPLDSFYGRYMVLARLAEYLAVGPQLEITVNLRNAAENDARTVSSLPIGAHLDLGYGPGATFSAFFAYQTRSTPASEIGNLFGRLSFSYVYF